MSNKGRHYFYQGFDIHVRWLNPEPVPGYGIKLGWRKKVHSLSEAYSSRVIAAVIAQSVIDKIISTQARAVQVPDTLQ